ncbi:SusD/RagB family nutrient-binding outer membrane lipoprotein [Pedobacter faecalis]|uniref:SusD/RagB family nutrient-binding outer membrane lipoprotein n=1 Tax=Pedobacter faecalis TaxID=3041495 RepID=UPI00254DA626|nr:SusD/RagB family nutrient-binding outer membrane lipoprotein [Pedobacter sp. ELA7]
MKKINIVFSLLVVLLGSCSKFEEINKNPNNPSTVPAEMLLPPIISSAVGSMNASGSRAGQYVQHLAWLGGTSESDGRYNLTGASYREEWNGPMRLIKDVNQLAGIAQANGQTQYQAIAAIMKVYILSLMTDAYGDIPYDEAGMGNVTGLEFPKYQAQQEVYERMLTDLESANQLLKNLPAGTVISRDILFAGNAARWRKFANSLKIRILMRQSNKADAAARIGERVAAIFNNPSEYPVFTSAAEQAMLVYNNSTDFYSWYIQNPPADGSGVNFGDNARVSDVMVNFLKAANDPRLTIFAAPTKKSYDANKANPAQALVYRGIRAGLSSEEQKNLYPGLDNNDFSVIGSRIRKENRAFLFTYAELMLLKAEAIQRNMGVTGVAATAYLDGVRASFDNWPQLAGAQAAAPYISDAQKTAYFQQTGVGLSATEPLKQIAEQLWVNAFLNGFEGWAGWRRTGYPQLVPGPTVLSPIPVRYVYSDNEQNSPSLLAWVNANMGGKMPTHNTKVWFQP